jgi:choline dehydrogenase-like flavoprotein
MGLCRLLCLPGSGPTPVSDRDGDEGGHLLTPADTLNRAWTDDLGYPFLKDAYGGVINGIAFKPMTSDGKNQTRCTARKAYYDPVQRRPNLKLLVNSYVGKVLVRDSKARGVEVYSRNDATAKVSISAKKEVILAAGGIHTPQILQLSGIGPRDLLERLKIPVVEDLPGVGANFMDHPTIRGAAFKCEWHRKPRQPPVLANSQQSTSPTQSTLAHSPATPPSSTPHGTSTWPTARARSRRALPWAS